MAKYHKGQALGLIEMLGRHSDACLNFQGALHTNQGFRFVAVLPSCLTEL